MFPTDENGIFQADVLKSSFLPPPPPYCPTAPDPPLLQSKDFSPTASASNFSHSAQETNSGKIEDCTPVVTRKKTRFSRRQWITLLVCMVANFGCAACVSLQAPFYPAEAERKRIRPAVYGFVFGIFSLVVFITAPFFGKYVGMIGPKFLLNSGIFMTSSCCMLFGLLDRTPAGIPFITLSFIIRIVEALGEASYTTASFTIISQEFPDHVGTTFALLRACFGMGLIAGPSIGGVLYEIGGYMFPFMTMGGMLFLISTATCLLYSGVDDYASCTPGLSLVSVLRVPSVCLSGFGISGAAASIGFLAATLEPHLRRFHLRPSLIGVMFIISGGVYALTSVIWGRLCDQKFHPKLLTAVGAVLMCIVYLLLGPAFFIPLDTNLWLCVGALMIHGVALGGELVAPYADALRESIRSGFPDDINTSGMIAGLWSSFFQLGNFIGPSLGGILFDMIGFRKGSVAILGLHALLAILNLLFYFYLRRKDKNSLQSKSYYGTVEENRPLKK